MKTFKPRLCLDCESTYIPTGPSAKYCNACAAQRRKESAAARSLRYRSKYQLVGVGSGGNQRGEDNPNWKGGVATYRQHRDSTCERCAAPAVLVHHRDHDRSNNAVSNLESLCKRCHQIEHRCWENFEGSETIPQGSTP